MAEVAVQFAIPSEALRPFISTYWELQVTGDGTVQDMLHPEWANIRMTLDRPWDYGPSIAALERLQTPIIMHGATSRPTYIRGAAGRNFGIGILPTGWNRLIGGDASAFADRYRSLSDAIGGHEADLLYAKIIVEPSFEGRADAADTWLLDRLSIRQRRPFESQVESLFQVVVDPASATVDELTNTLGLPHHKLTRLSKQGLGFPPKLLLRRQRFLRMLGTLHARPYAEWNDFLDPQYVDQSHMIRDFQRFLGMPPKRYFALPRPVLAAAAKARAEMFGQPLQGLHPAKAKTAKPSFGGTG
jgi:AraC-like DNA-binding protein